MTNIRAFEGMAPCIAPDAWIDDTALVIGDVEIGAGSSVWPMTVVRGDIHRIRIGEATNVQDGSVLHVTHDSRFYPGGFPLEIGDRVTIGHKVMLHGCRIGDRCLVGMAAVVMDGAVLEPEVVLAAGSLVSPGKVLEGGWLWRGAPARRVRELTDQEREFFSYSAENYRRLAARYRQG